MMTSWLYIFIEELHTKHSLLLFLVERGKLAGTRGSEPESSVFSTSPGKFPGEGNTWVREEDSCRSEGHPHIMSLVLWTKGRWVAAFLFRSWGWGKVHTAQGIPYYPMLQISQGSAGIQGRGREQYILQRKANQDSSFEIHKYKYCPHNKPVSSLDFFFI